MWAETEEPVYAASGPRRDLEVRFGYSYPAWNAHFGVYSALQREEAVADLETLTGKPFDDGPGAARIEVLMPEMVRKDPQAGYREWRAARKTEMASELDARMMQKRDELRDLQEKIDRLERKKEGLL